MTASLKGLYSPSIAHGQLIVAEFSRELTLRRLLLDPVPVLQAADADETVTLLDVSQGLPVG
jgi:DNA polymerase V